MAEYLPSVEGRAESRVIRRVWDGDRVQNKRLSADAALGLLIAHLETL